MKRFNNGEELAKEIGVKPEVLKKTCPSESSILAMYL
jgi:SUMO ligase MMS21 Smc5/6 complex component